MITHFEIGNFKAFGDIQRIQLSDINLIFGANSAGKSTLMQAFAYLDEALRSRNWDVHKTRLGGEYMDLGGLRNIVHKHDTNRIIHLGVTLDGYQIVATQFLLKALGDEKRVNDLIEQTLDALYAPEIYFETTYTIRFGIHPTEKESLEYLEIVEEEATLVGAPDVEFHLPKNKTVLRIRRYGLDFRIEDINVDTLFFNKVESVFGKYGFGAYDIYKEMGAIDSTLDPASIRESLLGKVFVTDDDDPHIGLFALQGVEDDEIKNEMDAIHLPKIIIDLLNTELNSMASFIGIGFDHMDGDYPLVNSTNLSKVLSTTNHIGYVRSTPSRHLTLQEAYGTVYEALLLNDRLVNEVNASFDDIGIGLHVVRKTWSTKEKKDRREITTLELFDHRRNTYVSFRDVGQGVMQILPILAAIHSWPLEKYNIVPPRYIFIEQPELHIHPAVQSGIGKVLAKRFGHYVPKWDEHEKPKKHFIIETHSEHLIKSLQLEVARFTSTDGREGLNPTYLSINYVAWDAKKHQAVIRPIQLDAFGSFTEPWPDDFFDAGADLTMERLRMMNRN